LITALAHKLFLGDFITSGSFPQIFEHLSIADRGGCKQQAKAGLFKFQVYGENGNLRPDHFKEIIECFKSLAAQAETEAETSLDQHSLLAASLAHITCGQVFMISSTEEDHAAARELAESELRIAVVQNLVLLEQTLISELV